MYGIDVATERARAPKFHDMHGEWRDYKFFNHITDATGREFKQDDFVAAMRVELKGDYLFEDVTSDIIDQIDAILTFGNRPFQELKLSMCPQLAGIERHIILRSKGDYIHDTFTRPVVMIDDKMLRAEILPPHVFIHINRSLIPDPDPSEGYAITSFRELGAALKRIENDTPSIH